MVKKKSTNKPRGILFDVPTTRQTTQYEITDDPMPDHHYQQLPKVIKKKLSKLYQQAQHRPQRAIPALRALRRKYPHIPQIYNFLTVAYSRAGQPEKAEAITRQNIRKNPHYLFARVNLAEFCLARKEYEKIPQIFEHNYDLKMLYPQRDCFHIAEVANFMGMMGLYFHKTGQRELAEKYNDFLQEIASDFPIVQWLNQELNPGLGRRLLRYLTGRTKT